MDLPGPAAVVLMVVLGLGMIIWYILPDKWKAVLSKLWTAYEEPRQEETQKKIDEEKHD